MRLLATSLILTALLAGCASESLPTGPVIDSRDDLLTALRDAGAEVTETAILPTLPGLSGGRTYLVDHARLDIFEFETHDARGQALDDLERLGGSASRVWSEGRLIVAYDGSDGPTIALLSGLLGDVISLPEEAAIEPYPPAVAAAIGWVSEASGWDPGNVAVIAYEPFEWPDACLGLAAPDEMCAQVITSGWRIILQAGETSIVVRTDDLGSVVRAEP